jgi:hypothetical protein
MHGKKFLIERAYAGLNEKDFFFRLDLTTDLLTDYEIHTRIEVLPSSISRARKAFVARFQIQNEQLVSAELSASHESSTESTFSQSTLSASFHKILRARVTLSEIDALEGDTLLLRFTIVREQLPLDSLPAQGWMELPVVPEEQMLETGDYAW